MYKNVYFYGLKMSSSLLCLTGQVHGQTRTLRPSVRRWDLSVVKTQHCLLDFFHSRFQMSKNKGKEKKEGSKFLGSWINLSHLTLLGSWRREERVVHSRDQQQDILSEPPNAISYEKKERRDLSQLAFTEQKQGHWSSSWHEAKGPEKGIDKARERKPIKY